ncbi:extensin-like domain-containing protein [Pseudorhodobacter aquimaris]|uniref:extensin-like domain-containing protein n=1 Tax=Pseudorhodobacter aquimaris TaxID=687412 RepID=UPI00067B33A3|nr:extensin family protein [Pseudorhodobacter aquimaris]
MRIVFPLLLAAFGFAAPGCADDPSQRPKPRPDAAVFSNFVNAGRQTGFVCNDRSVQGVKIPKIKGKVEGCGIEDPVRVTSVGGVALSAPVTLDCDTAQALSRWVTKEAKPAFAVKGLVGLRVAAHYSCRTRNHKKGARISEHGRGKAIDIAGFQLKDGTEVSVLQHFRKRQGAPIRKAHKGACGIFGTTLGPGSDGHHMDHLHFDTASYRGGPYCK